MARTLYTPIVIEKAKLFILYNYLSVRIKSFQLIKSLNVF